MAKKKFGYFFCLDQYVLRKVPMEMIERANKLNRDYDKDQDLEVNLVIEEMRKYPILIAADFASQTL